MVDACKLLEHQMTSRLPHPIPYQGSKRNLADLIAPYIPDRISTFYEPFCGSAAMTIFAAHHNMAERFILGDSLCSIVELLQSIVELPDETSDRYRIIWEGQMDDNPTYFNEVRDRYNSEHDPVDLLYLICRCVKNAVRFNRHGNFTQSADKRRKGMRPEKMAMAIAGVSHLLSDRVQFRSGDWKDTVADAGPSDFVYMDPPYMGTSVGRDKRYHQQLSPEELIDGLSIMRARDTRFALSYDGMTGEKEYGPPLPDSLGLTRLLLHAGISSQATLSGKRAETVESLYLSPGLTDAVDEIIRPAKAMQGSLDL